MLGFWNYMSDMLQVDVFAYECKRSPTPPSILFSQTLRRQPLAQHCVHSAGRADSGYGHSTGTPSEDNMYSDARAALQLLVSAPPSPAEWSPPLAHLTHVALPRWPRRDSAFAPPPHYPRVSSVLATAQVEGFKLKPERDIILYGKSIGSCPTCHLASRTRVRGVMIVSGLASGSRVLFPTNLRFSSNPLNMLYVMRYSMLSTRLLCTHVQLTSISTIVAFLFSFLFFLLCNSLHLLLLSPPFLHLQHIS